MKLSGQEKCLQAIAFHGVVIPRLKTGMIGEWTLVVDGMMVSIAVRIRKPETVCLVESKVSWQWW